MKINRKIFKRIDDINWFNNCGSLTEENKNLNFTYVNNWEQARKYYTDVSWENTTLEARNTLTEFLHDKYPNKYSEWNSIVKEAKVYIETSLSTQLQIFREQQNLDNIFVDCVKWDILHAIMEFAYSDCRKLPVFFLDLLLVYENGNFPCGWDGNYPNSGKLIVY